MHTAAEEHVHARTHTQLYVKECTFMHRCIHTKLYVKEHIHTQVHTDTAVCKETYTCMLRKAYVHTEL